MNSELNKYCAWAAAVTMLMCSLPLQGQSIGKVSVFNLRDYGWETPELIRPHELDTAGRRSIVIDHKGRVLVGFVVQARSGLVAREQPALAYRIVSFMADGNTEILPTLPTNGWRTNSIYLSARDNIIVRANDSLQILELGTDAALRRGGSWKAIERCAAGCRIWQSPSRQTLLLRRRQANPPLTFTNTSAEPPSVKRCGTDEPIVGSVEDRIFQNDPQAITDDFAYHSIQLKSDVEDYFSHNTSVAGTHVYRWPLCDFEHRVLLPRILNPDFAVLNDRFLVTKVDSSDKKGIAKELDVISTDGHIKFSQELAKHESWDNFLVPIRSDEQGDRIAADILTVRGGNRTLDISGHVTARRIAVYDIEAGEEVASIPVEAKHRYRYEFDLSPDGKHLAILEDATVKLVDLGQAGTGNKPAEHANTVDPKRLSQGKL